jgi:mRNA-degrading endonuclease RelE of RelBE toxin-antitoxin system
MRQSSTKSLRELEKQRNAVSRLMDHSISENCEKFELGGEITHGRMNFEKMMTKIETGRIGIIFDPNFNTFKELQELYSLEEFLEDNQVAEFPPETLIDIRMFTKNWASINIKGCKSMDLHNLTEEQEEIFNEGMKNLNGKQRNLFNRELNYEKEMAIKDFDRYKESKYRLIIQYNQMKNQLKQDKKDMIQEKLQADLKIKEFESLLAKYFSDNVISKIRPHLKNGNYQEAMDELKMLIYDGNAVHLMHLHLYVESSTIRRMKEP